jgi:sulfatase maturation enzyme AslB (radical SAM superfamily)
MRNPVEYAKLKHLQSNECIFHRVYLGSKDLLILEKTINKATLKEFFKKFWPIWIKSKDAERES